MNSWLRFAVSLVIIWAVAGGVIFWSHGSKPTPASVTTYIQTAGLPSKSAAQREKAIARVATMLNSLTFEERQTLDKEGVTREFYKGLTPIEQIAFMDATLPTGCKQMMEAFNKMTPEKRKELVNRSLAEMKKHEGETPPKEFDSKIAQRIVDQGLRAFYSDANADVKLDLAPLIEQMQKNLQTGR